MKNAIIVLLVLIIIGFSIILFSFFESSANTPYEWKNRPKRSSNYQALQGAMSYLLDIPEIEWYEIQGNDIYIGFNTLPSDWRIIINGAALRANETIDFGVHVWAIDSNRFNKGWRPGDGSYYGEVTARYGKIR